MPQSRPSMYCFALQDDSVFADFDLDDDGRIFLARISFDGYGCCGTADQAGRMSLPESKHFIDLIEDNRVGSKEFIELLLRYLKDNKDILWTDALEEYELLPRSSV
jgi:hypothetical protein